VLLSEPHDLLEVRAVEGLDERTILGDFDSLLSGL